jgi:hypothetical protein
MISEKVIDRCHFPYGWDMMTEKSCEDVQFVLAPIGAVGAAEQSYEGGVQMDATELKKMVTEKAKAIAGVDGTKVIFVNLSDRPMTMIIKEGTELPVPPLGIRLSITRPPEENVEIRGGILFTRLPPKTPGEEAREALGELKKLLDASYKPPTHVVLLMVDRYDVRDAYRGFGIVVPRSNGSEKNPKFFATHMQLPSQ